MRKGEALYTYFMKTLGRQVEKNGHLELWLDESNAIEILQALFEMPDDIFDGIIKEKI